MKPTITDILKSISIETWERIEMSWNTYGLKTYEVTLTQNLIYLLKRYNRVSNQRIRVFEAINEKANGNDLEFFVKYRNGYVFFAIQAKLLYKINKYSKLNHTVNGVQQIDNLINYANNQKGIAIYFFYNSSLNNNIGIHLKSQDFKEYGISFSLAETIRNKFYNNSKWLIPSFKDVNPVISWPLHEILPKQYFSYVTSKLEFVTGLQRFKDEVKYFSIEEIVNDASWQEVLKPESIGRPGKSIDIVNKIKPKKNDSENIKFNAKFRFVFEMEEFKNHIIEMS